MQPSSQTLSKQGHHLICQLVNPSMTLHFSTLMSLKLQDSLQPNLHMTSKITSLHVSGPCDLVNRISPVYQCENSQTTSCTCNLPKNHRLFLIIGLSMYEK